jgi:hypothetical protein
MGKIKMLKLLYIAFICILISLFGCSDDCENENPTVQLVNSGTGKADIQIKTSGGNTENINNVETGTSSERRSFSPGQIEFTIAIQGVAEPLVYNLTVEYCRDYTVTINSENTVSGSFEIRE